MTGLASRQARTESNRAVATGTVGSVLPSETRIRAVVYQRATPLATRSLLLEGSRLDERAAVVGALALVRGHMFSPDGLSGLLG